jgi:hypothetical protein
MMIDEVLDQLDVIIADASRDNDPMGFFAYIYRRTTAQIKQAIHEGKFEDNHRMEKFDVHFAGKYLDACRDYQSGRVVCAPWAVAFDAAKTKVTIIQNIILGMNAHINFDLGMAAAEFMNGQKIDSMKNDFMQVNNVLASLVDELQVKVGRVSRLMFLLDLIGKRSDEAVMNFSMAKARKQAWNFAIELSVLEGNEKKAKISEVEEFTRNLGELVKSPPGRLFNFMLKLISSFEEKDIKKIISKLES